ncbi:3-deoxy-manno-octulosonate cytidylyltransferase [Alkalihalobacillus alcalophilus ATCC 27647 = CGMCC 1.3604]|uniref:3-deoxy-manno-octulosonate cytidylyltransferase n=1 Tax=Alkalihalobacillus alcalophilus ATCC 27647 = CGMCC 1.3604 TaxID=1218173 RepID=A0A094WJ89_ALKAL|nr:3-deoxy-manno-octulosonate cytidylyltransferase [Alkalihalobacillus alcalophilus]KGA96906.1 3-deoxy-manno-octulosonate cytidylyltransferase [Alkalihalobacillus alcalophilus ATCC 27647 = CGMCC 1.3604]MED1562625.1 3-deoxy-manno-octulosonate cytidylyltransferase [Alkalihalobacillus alcalophilus]THG88615.1 3-deoxy-manno-octulosonate cytidylyltransferase [Alkalihalobacillus alcalophilus ATCC 27647 = CGMCC 1.3604]
MKVVGVIPARYGSTRFPGKPLALINGKPMIQRVYEQVCKSKELAMVVVATDHDQIKKAVEDFGGTAIMTRADHQTGSDRIAEVAKKIAADFYVNIQGDEPLIQAELIDALMQTAKASPEAVVTAKTVIKEETDILNPNVVKVVTGENAQALYFSRSAVPYNRSGVNQIYYKHLGLYGYPRNVLKRFVQLPASELEKAEVLEQLRLIENGYVIKVIETEYEAIGVDTPEDIKKVEQLLGGVQIV